MPFSGKSETNPTCSSSFWRGPVGAGPPRDGSGPLLPTYFQTTFAANSLLSYLIRFFANFLACPFPSEGGFNAFLFTGFQVKRVALNLFDNVFLLYLALETAQGVFEGFPLLQSNFRQTNTPPNSSGRTVRSYKNL